MLDAPPPAAPADTIASRLDGATKPVADAARRLDRAKKALDALGKRGALDDLGALEDAAKQLTAAASAVTDLAPVDLAGLADAVTAHRDATLQRRRGEFISALRRLGREQSVPVDLLGDSPPTFLVAPLTCSLDLDKGEASLLFAHEVVASCDLDAARVLATRAEAVAAIQAAAIPSADFFDHLHRAYEVTLLARGGAPGDRVDLVDLLGPLALIAHPPERWRALSQKDLAPYPRHMLAYQLYRLRRDGLLERAGLRVELGAATGGSTRKKRDVLFVPQTPTDGQYHLSIRFTAS